MTHTNLKSYLTTAATAAGVTNFIYGYYDELQKRQNELYPAILILPAIIPIKTRTGNDNQVDIELQMFIYDSWSYESISTRESVWDAINTKAILFFQSIASNANVGLVTIDGIASEPTDLGDLVSSVIACKYKFILRGC
jgi:hypothetical protein